MINVFEIEGVIEEVDAGQTKNGGPMVKLLLGGERAFNDNVERASVPFTLFGRSASKAALLKPGAVVMLSGQLNGRYWEKGDRHFLDAYVREIEVKSAANDEDKDLPF